MKKSAQDLSQCPIAVVGMSCRFPRANSLEEYWSLISEQRSGFGEIPADRLDQELYFNPEEGVIGKTYSKVGGVVDDIPFDNSKFNLPDSLVKGTDFTHLRILEVARESLEHAGLDIDALKGERAGVFMGHARGSLLNQDIAYAVHIKQWIKKLAESEELKANPKLLASVSENLLTQIREKYEHLKVPKADLYASRAATLISETFGFNGPSMAVDAACASSMVGLNIGIQSLLQNQINLAVVGGVSFSAWTSMIVFSFARSVSANGSFPFDERADGFISSDGYASIVLKRLPDALENEDNILGVIRGIGVSSDGRGKSLWAPRKEGQIKAIERAYGDRIDPATVEFVEAHGTSTQVGDATELESISEAFRAISESLPAIPVSSVKANIGHTRETAGMAGLIKTLLIMQHEKIPAATNYATPSPEIKWDTMSLFVPTEPIAWPADPRKPRRAAVESFGIGGLNVHVVVDDHIPNWKPEETKKDDGNPEPIAVIGMGALFPKAKSVLEFENLLRSGSDAKEAVPQSHWDVNSFEEELKEAGLDANSLKGGFVNDFEYDWRKNKIPPKQVENADPIQFMILEAAEQALVDADWKSENFNRENCGVVVGSEFQSDFGIQLTLGLRLPEFQADLVKELVKQGKTEKDSLAIAKSLCDSIAKQCPALHDETASYSASTMASRITKTFDLMGGACSVDASGSSSSAALDVAIQQLRAKNCETMLCAGGQRSTDLLVYRHYAEQGHLTSEGGLIPGEGVGTLLLKRLSDAERDGDHIHAVIHGHDVSDSTESAVERVTDSTEVDSQRVSVLTHSAFGVETLDHEESDGLAKSYSIAESDSVKNLKSLFQKIGYASGASGMALMLQTILSSKSKEASVFAGVHSKSLSGQTYHALIEVPIDTVKNSPEGEVVAQPIVYRIGATDLNELKTKIASAGQAESVCVGQFQAQHLCRLAIVANSSDEFGEKLKLAINSLEKPELKSTLELKGVFLGESNDERPRTAFLFSGQGSQYKDMLKSLIQQIPAAAEELKSINSTLEAMSLPTFEQIAWEEGELLGKDLFRTQLSILVADVLLFRIVTSLGITPDVVSDHSFGEYPALVATEAWTLEDAIRVTQARCDAIESLGSNLGVMMATTASKDVVLGLVQELDLSQSAFMANHNSPEQVVVSGTTEGVKTLVDQLELKDYRTTMLPVPGPFHSPLMQPATKQLRACLEEINIRPPRIPLLSSVTNRYTSDPQEIRENIANQLTGPVEFVDQIARLKNEGCDLFVEIGPKQVLTKLVQKITEVETVPVCSTDSPKLDGIEQLVRLQAFLDVNGYVKSDADRANPISLTAGKSNPSEILHFDATEVRRKKNAEKAPATTAVSVSHTEVVASSDNAAADELENFLITFVCEQTGYPPEIVDLDGDLEADLGIDSIKKAQLLGELREHFPIEPTADLSLDDFPTLRHIGAFIRESSSEVPETVGVAAPSSNGTPVPSNGELLKAITPKNIESKPTQLKKNSASENAAWKALNVHRFSGTPFEIGSQHGLVEEKSIRKTMLRYLDLLGPNAFEDQQLGPALEQAELFFGKEGIEELKGMAHSVGLPLQTLVVFNFGLVLPVMQLLPGCTQFAIPASANGNEGLIHGVNEDWNMGRVLQGAFRRVTQVRREVDAIPYLTFGACGQLGGMNGINKEGLALSSTLLLDRMPTAAFHPGLVHFVIVQRVLSSCKTIEEAVELISSLPRNSSWSVCLSDHNTDNVCYLEYDVEKVETNWVENFYGSTNHCLIKDPVRDPEDQSKQRHQRLCELLKGRSNGSTKITLDAAKNALRDQYDQRFERETAHPTKWTIRQPDTQMSFVMKPATKEVYVTADIEHPEDPHTFHKLDLNELFDDVSSGSEKTDLVDQNYEIDPENIPHPERVMNRFVMRMVNEPLTNQSMPGELSGFTLVVGNTPVADAIAKSFSDRGLDLLRLQKWDNPNHAVEQLKQLWNQEQISHLLFVPDSQDAETFDFSNFDQRIDDAALVPFLICQNWTMLLQQTGFDPLGTITAVTSMGGDFGLLGNEAAIDGGGLSGMLKTISHEFEHIRIKAIDTALADPPQLIARNVIEEILSGDPNLEVGYLRGTRRTLLPVPRPLNNSESDVAIEPSGTWVITGGGRGITFQVARALARKYKINLHLIGSSPVPEIEVAWRTLDEAGKKELKAAVFKKAREERKKPPAEWQKVERAIELDANLKSLKEEGLSATYHSCDLSNRKEVDAVLQEIRAQGEPITGIMHGAGLESACRMGKKKLELVQKTIRVKVNGAAYLMDLTSDDPIQHFIGFGSVSGRFGSPGQTDYSLASNLLSKLIGQYRKQNPDCQSVTFNWPPWDEVGMAVRPESRIVLEVSGIKFMPVQEGVNYLIEELQEGCPESEVMLVDWPSRKGSKSCPFSARDVEQIWMREKNVHDLPLIDGLANFSAEEKTQSFDVHYDPVKDPFLAQHRLEHVGILPGVLGVESLWEAATLFDPLQIPKAITNLKIHHAWKFDSHEAQSGKVKVVADSNRLLCSLESDFRNAKGHVTEPSRKYVSAEISFDPIEIPFTFRAPEEKAEWHNMRYDSEAIRSQGRMVWHGEIYQGLKRLKIYKETIWGEVIADSLQALQGNRNGVWKTPSALLDCCMQCASAHVYIQSDLYILPIGFDVITFGTMPKPDEKCMFQADLVEQNEREVLFDFQLRDSQNRVVIAAKNFRSGIVSVVDKAMKETGKEQGNV